MNTFIKYSFDILILKRCLQLQKSIQELAPNLICLPILGGTGYESQIRRLNGKVDIVCATPGIYLKLAYLIYIKIIYFCVLFN